MLVAQGIRESQTERGMKTEESDVYMEASVQVYHSFMLWQLLASFAKGKKVSCEMYFNISQRKCMKKVIHECRVNRFLI